MVSSRKTWWKYRNFSIRVYGKWNAGYAEVQQIVRSILPRLQM
jgi:hypothetical protein